MSKTKTPKPTREFRAFPCLAAQAAQAERDARATVAAGFDAQAKAAFAEVDYL